jgi:uncharacterized repeat protein (TIGR03803 family)
MRNFKTINRLAAVGVMLGALIEPAAASVFKTLYTTPAGTTFTPVVGIETNKMLYGTDPTGGTGKGLMWALSESGQLSTIHTFTYSDGVTPNGRLAQKGGTLIGTTVTGGAAGTGTIFSVNTSNANKFTVLHVFNSTTDGVDPRDGLVLDTLTGLYIGTASMDAITPGNGTLYAISSTGTFTVLWSFMSGADGHCPYTGVAIDQSGNIYGTSVGFGYGGNPKGSIWGLVPGGSVQTLYVFTNGADGEYPTIAPSVDSAGNLWGVSTTQKSNPYAGVIWEIPSAGSFTIVHSFTGGADGYGPDAPLLLAQDGSFYGVTKSGGSGYGTFFRITTAGVLSVIHTFTGGADGGTPTGNLVIDTSGQIYGGTAQGTIFRYTP